MKNGIHHFSLARFYVLCCSSSYCEHDFYSYSSDYGKRIANLTFLKFIIESRDHIFAKYVAGESTIEMILD